MKQIAFACIMLVAVALADPALGVEIGLPDARLKLNLADASGRITRVTLGGINLTAPPAVPASGFSLATGPTAELVPLACRVTTAPDGSVRFEGSTGALRLSGTARRVGRGLELSGVVADARGPEGTDHAVTLRFALPVRLSGWRMDRDLERSWLLEPNLRRSTATPVGWGRGACELWPVVAVAGKTATLGLGSRLDEPQTFRVAYDGPQQLLSIEADLALAAVSRRWPCRAPFRFLLLARADDWGLRGCLEQYYQTYPSLFRKRTELAGGWFAWGDILSIAAPAVDFGLAYHEGPDGPQARRHSLALGAKTFPYIEPTMYQMPLGDFDRQPTAAEAEERVQAWAKPLDPLPPMHRGEYDQTRCAATVASGLRRPDGTLEIAAIGQYPWIQGSQWAAQFALNLDPGIPGGAGKLYLREDGNSVRDPAWGEGRYLDSFSAHVDRLDYAPEHLAHSTLPLAWQADAEAPGGFRVCQPVAAATFAYANGLRALMDAHGKLILVNQFGHGAPCPFHVFDCLGKEYWVSGAGRLLQRYRAVSQHKVVSNLPSDKPIPDTALREFLVYGVFPGGYGRGDWGQEQMRAAYRRVLPLLRLEHRLRWEPVPHARAQSGVVVERFGGGRGRSLCLAVHNRYTPKVVTLVLDRAALGLPDDLWCRELLDDGPVAWSVRGAQVEIRLGMQSGETKLLAVGGPATHAAIARVLAADRLRDARLCAAEFRLREGRVHPLEADLKRANPRDAAALRALAARATGTEVLTQRIGELLREGAAWAAAAAQPPRRRPRAVSAPALDTAATGLPWTEDFSRGLSEEEWLRSEGRESRIEVRDGRLEMELSPKEMATGITSRRVFDFGAQPLEFRWRFQFNHAGHPYYLMQSVTLRPPGSSGDDYLSFRVDPGIRLRLENADTRASNYQYALTPYADFATNVPHTARLILSGERFLLEVDGQKLGEGPHDLGFTQATLTLGVYTGHYGHGDVVWWDDLTVRPAALP
ncbi:MAG: hypothetical protein GX774_21965 [Armatimonadetes bacterium]|nr:hypothetical protein [Armatimonadota bacterium]